MKRQKFKSDNNMFLLVFSVFSLITVALFTFDSSLFMLYWISGVNKFSADFILDRPFGWSWRSLFTFSELLFIFPFVNKFDSFFAFTFDSSSKTLILNSPIIFLLVSASFLTTGTVISFLDSSKSSFLKMFVVDSKFSKVDGSSNRNYFLVIRFYLNGWHILLSNYLICGDTLNFYGILNSMLLSFLISYSSSLHSQGVIPTKSSYKTTPTEKISL